MQIEITYIFHNCFVLQLPDKAFLFDYPADEYLTEARRAAIISRIRDTDLYLCSSHNHHDHFNRKAPELSTYTKSLTYILSRDIVKNNRQFKAMPSCYTVEADQSYTINDFTVDTFLSNDEGVAFLIHLGPLNIYFGGDLANWNWDDLTKQEIRLLVDYFGEVLLKLKPWPVQIAFSNTDQRLPNWAGAAQFIETVKPGLFVPMHTFGETQSIAKFLSENPELESKIFQYRETGDSVVWEV
jgi:L-ascorbate metabolism protein UlaG (beta-lactamase superfamily)